MKHEQEDSQENILVMGPSWVGDMVMAQSLFIRLKDRYINSRLSVMAPDWTRPLLERMPEVDQAISLPFKQGQLNFLARRNLGKSLKAQHFTRAILLPNSFKSALIPYYAEIPVRIGWLGEWRKLLLSDCRRLDKQRFPLMVQRFAALADPVSDVPPGSVVKPRLQSDPAEVEAAIEQFGLSTDGKILAVCPGAEFGKAKQWPAEHYAHTCNALIADGWKMWIFGSSNDTAIAQSILANIETRHRKSCVSLAGQTTLAQAIDLMSVTDATISNDSGLMHIAAALDKAVVALYGSTSPDFTPPLTDRVKLLATEIECRPCFKRDCPYGHLKCLTELKPARAISAINELIIPEQG